MLRLFINQFRIRTSCQLTEVDAWSRESMLCVPLFRLEVLLAVIDVAVDAPEHESVNLMSVPAPAVQRAWCYVTTAERRYPRNNFRLLIRGATGVP